MDGLVATRRLSHRATENGARTRGTPPTLSPRRVTLGTRTAIRRVWCNGGVSSSATRVPLFGSIRTLRETSCTAHTCRRRRGASSGGGARDEAGRFVRHRPHRARRSSSGGSSGGSSSGGGSSSRALAGRELRRLERRRLGERVRRNSRRLLLPPLSACSPTHAGVAWLIERISTISTVEERRAAHLRVGKVRIEGAPPSGALARRLVRAARAVRRGWRHPGDRRRRRRRE
jgi:hypothetical protein